MIDGWIHAGSIGYLDVEGCLLLCDRANNMITKTGENTYPAEVESAPSGHEAVADVAAIGAPGDRWSVQVHPFVVLRARHEISPEG